MSSKAERKILGGFQKSGNKINIDKLNAGFKFLIRPLTTVGVESLDLSSWYEDEVFFEVKDMQFGSNIGAIVISPVIFNTNIAEPPKDKVIYKRLERSVFVSLRVSMSSWDCASRQGKNMILSENIKQSLERIPKKYLNHEELGHLLLAVKKAYGIISDKLLN